LFSVATTSPRLTTLTLFGVREGHLRWGLAQMATSVPYLQKTPGLVFFKLLGSGHGKGFSLKPNLRRYGLLCTWESESDADEFLNSSQLLEEYKEHCEETWTVKLHAYQSHGQWNKQEPFYPLLSEQYTSGPIAVLTRASINWLALPDFWRFVPTASKALENAEGLICSIGLGELPLIRQATFSIWESEQSMKAYAYRHKAHQDVIKRTRAKNWYNEELFARFKPVSSAGCWNGINPLKDHLMTLIK
jgi:heme-degrading monooxygenase HmoA